MVESGGFRLDLFYRLSQLSSKSSAPRTIDDIPLLVDKFLRRLPTDTPGRYLASTATHWRNSRARMARQHPATATQIEPHSCSQTDHHRRSGLVGNAAPVRKPLGPLIAAPTSPREA